MWRARGEDRESLGRLDERHALPCIHSWRYSSEKHSFTCPRGSYQDRRGLVTVAPEGSASAVRQRSTRGNRSVVIQRHVIQQLSEAQPFATQMDLTNITPNKRSQTKGVHPQCDSPFSTALGRGSGRGERRPGAGAPWGRPACRDWHSSGEEAACGHACGPAQL